MINPNTKVVPIDHGWANMKTEQDVFTSGVSEITTEPALFNDVLEYNNKYYKIGGKRLEVKEDKVHDDNYYLPTLAATAMTLERLHIRDAHVLWAVGLPLTRTSLCAKSKSNRSPFRSTGSRSLLICWDDTFPILSSSNFSGGCAAPIAL